MRICYKIHIFGFTSQHLCVSGSFARSMSLDSCLSIHVYLRILCKIHAAGFIAQQPYVSQDPLQDPRLQIHVSASLYLTDSLQDPRQRLRIHVSASLYLRILCKFHVSGSMSPIHVSASICISGTSAKSMSPDPYLRILCKIHVSDSCLSIYIPQGPCKIHVSGFMSQHLYISGSSARSMSPDPYISIHMYLKLLCKIHVSGSVYKHPYVSQDPLRDPCLRIHVSASTCISGTSAKSMSPDPYLRILCKIHVSDSCLSIYIPQGPCKIHVSGFMSQHLYISGSSARSMSPDPYISIHMYLKLLCKIHVSGSVYKHPYVSQDPLRDPCLRIHVSASTCISGTSARSMSPDP